MNMTNNCCKITTWTDLKSIKSMILFWETGVDLGWDLCCNTMPYFGKGTWEYSKKKHLENIRVVFMRKMEQADHV